MKYVFRIVHQPVLEMSPNTPPGLVLGHEFQIGINKLYMGRSVTSNIGVYAGVTIPKDSIIMQLPRPENPANILNKEPGPESNMESVHVPQRGEYWLYDRTQQVTRENIAFFINWNRLEISATNANCKWVPYPPDDTAGCLDVTSIRVIKPGEQLLLDYCDSETYMTGKEQAKSRQQSAMVMNALKSSFEETTHALALFREKADEIYF